MLQDHRLNQLLLAANQKTREKQYWLKKFSGELIKSVFPYDYREKGKEPEIKEVNHRISNQLSLKLMRLCNNSDFRLHMVLVTAVVVLLYKYSGSKDITVGMPIYKQGIEGNLINTVLPLRNHIKENISFKELLLNVRNVIEEANENRNYPIEVLPKQLNMEFSKNGDFPLFDVAVLLKNIHDRNYIRQIPFNMIFSFWTAGKDIEVALEYNSRVYRPLTAKKVLHHLLNLLHNTLLDIDANVSFVDILSGLEKRKILFEFNHSTEDTSRYKTVGQLIETQAGMHPGHVAIVCKDKRLTYRELNKRADGLAGFLQESGIGKEQPIGIMLERSPLMAVSIIAAWKLGCSYIPIDYQHPPERIHEIIKDAGLPIILVQREYAHPLPGEKVNPRLIKLDEKKVIGNRQNKTRGSTDNKVNINTLAYVIYTSGSTGKPKGVMVEHLGMMNHIKIKINDLNISAKSVVAQNAAHTFDISVWQFFAALTVGGAAVIFPGNIILDQERFIAKVIQNRVSLLEVVPSYLSVLLDSLDVSFKDLDCLDYLVVTGEELKSHLVKRWFKKYPGIKMVNAYGPTEASDDITHYIMNKTPDRERIPIGKPLQNLGIYILDQNMKLCPIGIKGEICVSGAGVGRGYLNNPESTSERFICAERKAQSAKRLLQSAVHKSQSLERNKERHALCAVRHASIYRTGDLGRWLSDGNIEFFGRKDHQVKIRGFRIELGEIESRLSGHPGIKEAVVIAAKSGGEHPALCAYYVPAQGSSTPAGSYGLKEFLAKELPGYMVPAHFVELEQMPLTVNGKIDRKRLPAVDMMRRQIQHEAPANEIEKKLARIWSDLLGIKTIGINDNFFQLGGNSLLAMKAVSLVYREFNVKVPLIDFFRVGTIKGIAKIIVKLQRGTGEKEKIKKDGLLQPFDLNQVPLFRVKVVNLDPGRCLLYIDMPHIVTDGISINIIVDELFRIYSGRKIPAITRQYKDYSQWQQTFFAGEAFQKQEKYWIDCFCDKIPLLKLPLDYPRPEVRQGKGKTIQLSIGTSLSGELKRFSIQKEVTMFMLFFAAYNVLLSGYSGQEDIIVGTPVTGRTHPAVNKMNGIFMNTLALRSAPRREFTFNRFLAEIKERILEALENQDYQFEMLVEKLGLSGDINRNPLFDSMFELVEENSTGTVFEAGGLKVKTFNTSFTGSQCDLMLAVKTVGDDMWLNLTYDIYLFKEQTGKTILEDFKRLLSKIITHPTRKLALLSSRNQIT